MLDAARRTSDEQLFQRAIDIALQARAGEQALAAARAWRQALPESLDALRYQLQIAGAAEPHRRTSAEPLQRAARATPAPSARR